MENIYQAVPDGAGILATYLIRACHKSRSRLLAWIRLAAALASRSARFEEVRDVG